MNGERPPARTTQRATLALVHDVRVDLVYAVRLFARQPAVLILTIGGLSLGLGIATAAFSLMNAAVLRGDGLIDSERVPGILRTADRSVSTAWAYDEFLRLREGATRMQVEAVLTDTAQVRTSATDVDAPSASVAFVSSGFFTATGAGVIAGRPLAAIDERHAGVPPVVVSFVFWTSRLSGDPNAIGRTITVGRTTATIVGIAKRGVSVPSNRLLWLPLTAYGAVYDAPGRRTPDVGLQVFGRLSPGVTRADAEAQLNGVAAGLPDNAVGGPAPRAQLDPRAGLGRSSASDTLAIALFVFAVIALVLLLACANVTTVLVATAITREREMGVRAALGASRWRIVRQLMTESLALGALAASIGLMLAYWSMPAIGALIEAPPGADLTPDLNVYVFLGLVTVVTGAAAGLAPAWHSRSADLLTPLKGEGAHENRRGPRRLRSTLVMTQAAASVLLIVLATLFMRATWQSAAVDAGFEADGLYAVSPGPGDAFNDDGAGIRDFWARATTDLATIPGIAGFTLAESTPFGDATRTAIARGGSGHVVYFNRTRADYFETVGIRITAGRTFTREEVATGAPVALVSQSLARAYWHDASPIGQLLPLAIPLPPVMTATARGTSLVTLPRPVVVGIAADAVTARWHEQNAFAVYEPLDPAGERFAELVIRVAPGRTEAINLASQRLRLLDARADVRVSSIAARLELETSRPRVLAALTGIVGVVAIVLSVIGLYGLTASVLGQRTREMGIRTAMGAEPRDLLRLLMWDSLRPVLLGLGLGAGGALALSRVVVASMFFGVSPHDPLAFAGAAAIVAGAAALAVILPTRRAAAVDAAVVLHRY